MTKEKVLYAILSIMGVVLLLDIVADLIVRAL
jgi:hypothetical protein